VTEVRTTFEGALAGSPDMREQVRHACSKHGDMLVIHVFRGSGGLYLGQTDRNGIIQIDVEEIEEIPAALDSNQPADRQLVADNFLLEVLAHEVDHNRHAPGADHSDPPGLIQGKEGPAVTDENKVLMELKIPVYRNSYNYIDPSSRKVVIDYTVNGPPLIANIEQHKGERSTNKRRVTTHGMFVVVPSDLEAIPGGPCPSAGGDPCYTPPDAVDSDLDGVTDQADNCPGLPNPQQGDHDGDGTGAGCDPDDDADGAGDDLETATGCSADDPLATPEHWSCSVTPAVCGSAGDPWPVTDQDDPGPWTCVQGWGPPPLSAAPRLVMCMTNGSERTLCPLAHSQHSRHLAVVLALLAEHLDRHHFLPARPLRHRWGLLLPVLRKAAASNDPAASPRRRVANLPVLRPPGDSVP
jgi:hypothetical protein